MHKEARMSPSTDDEKHLHKKHVYYLEWVEIKHTCESTNIYQSIYIVTSHLKANQIRSIKKNQYCLNPRPKRSTAPKMGPTKIYILF
jgi:hypothetical protein